MSSAGSAEFVEVLDLAAAEQHAQREDASSIAVARFPVSDRSGRAIPNIIATARSASRHGHANVGGVHAAHGPRRRFSARLPYARIFRHGLSAFSLGDADADDQCRQLAPDVDGTGLYRGYAANRSAGRRQVLLYELGNAQRGASSRRRRRHAAHHAQPRTRDRQRRVLSAALPDRRNRLRQTDCQRPTPARLRDGVERAVRT